MAASRRLLRPGTSNAVSCAVVFPAPARSQVGVCARPSHRRWAHEMTMTAAVKEELFSRKQISLSRTFKCPRRVLSFCRRLLIFERAPRRKLLSGFVYSVEHFMTGLLCVYKRRAQKDTRIDRQTDRRSEQERSVRVNLRDLRCLTRITNSLFCCRKIILLWQFQEREIQQRVLKGARTWCRRHSRKGLQANYLQVLFPCLLFVAIN